MTTNDVKTIEIILRDEKTDVNNGISSAMNFSPLFMASANGHHAAVELLLKHHDIDVNQVNVFGTPLLIAASNGYTKIVKLLLQTAKIHVNQVSSYGCTALCLAAFFGRTEVVKLLLQKAKIDVNQCDSANDTPLLLASNHGYAEVVELLLAHPDIKVTTVDWSNLQVRMVYIMANLTIAKTAQESNLHQQIQTYYSNGKRTLAKHSGIINDITGIIYGFTRPSVTQVMALLNVDNI